MTLTRVRKYVGFDFSWPLLMKAICFSFFLASLFWGVNQFRQTQYFPIQSVNITGATHIDHDTIQRVVEPFLNKNFFSIDLPGMKESLLQLSWSSTVSVRRVWPDQLAITINEKKPIAHWNDASLLSTAGEIFTPPNMTLFSDLPMLIGPAGEQELVLNYYDQFNQLFLPLHLSISQLELTPNAAWNITLTNGIKLSVGYKDVLTRLTHFVKVYPKIIGDRASSVDYVDLRYPNGLAVRWKTSQITRKV